MLSWCPDASRLTVAPSLTVATSLGVLGLNAAIGDDRLERANADAAYVLVQGGHLWVWDRPSARAELLVCRPIYTLPSGMQVDDCWSALWRIQFWDDRTDASFTCQWEPGARWTDWDSAHGEGQVGWSYDDGSTVVSVVTEDEGSLGHRAAGDDWLPRRLLPRFDYDAPEFAGDLFEPDEHHAGVSVRFPDLRAGERLQVQFSVAWGTLSQGALPTWFAVGRSPKEILAGAGCTYTLTKMLDDSRMWDISSRLLF